MTKSKLSRSSLAADIDRANQWREPMRERQRTRHPSSFRDARRRLDVESGEVNSNRPPSLSASQVITRSSASGNFSQSLSQTGDVVTSLIRGSVVANNRQYQDYDCASSISAMASPRITSSPPLLLAHNPTHAHGSKSLKMITDCAYSREDTELYETVDCTEESNSYPAEVFVTEEMESKDLAQSRHLMGMKSILLLFIGALIGWILSRIVYHGKHGKENEEPVRLPNAEAEIPKRNGGPQWRDWHGSSYLDAVTTCSSSNFRSPCPYQSYCPGVRPQSDHISAEHGVLFAPVVVDSSLGWQWIRFGPDTNGSGEDSCSLRHQSSFSRDSITPQILCCEEEPNDQVLANLPDIIEPFHNKNPVKVDNEATELGMEQDETLSQVWIDSHHGWEGK